MLNSRFYGFIARYLAQARHYYRYLLELCDYLLELLIILGETYCRKIQMKQVQSFEHELLYQLITGLREGGKCKSA